MKWFLGNFACTRLATDSISILNNKNRQFHGLFDVYQKTRASDDIRGLYGGFGISIMGIILYRGMYFGLYDSLNPIVLIGSFQDTFVASFFLGWSLTTFSGICASHLTH